MNAKYAQYIDKEYAKHYDTGIAWSKQTMSIHSVPNHTRQISFAGSMAQPTRQRRSKSEYSKQEGENLK